MDPPLPMVISAPWLLQHLRNFRVFKLPASLRGGNLLLRWAPTMKGFCLVAELKDPVDGTDKKADQYWADVTKEYNKTTEVCGRRNRNHWDRVKKPVMDFHGCWVKTNKVYRSGVSDDQLMEIAEKMYAGEHSDKDFMLKHFWKVVRNERKWSAYVKKEQEKEKNKGAANKPAEVVNLEDNPNIRPMGHKKAKDEKYGKKKTPEAYSAISEKLDKFIEVSTLARKDREKTTETQQIMAHNDGVWSALMASQSMDDAVEPISFWRTFATWLEDF